MLCPVGDNCQYFRVGNNDCQVKYSIMGGFYQSTMSGSNPHSRDVPLSKLRNLPTLLHRWFAYQSFLSPRKFKENSRSQLFFHDRKGGYAVTIHTSNPDIFSQSRLHQADQRNDNRGWTGVKSY
jgi:hypothetical protein